MAEWNGQSFQDKNGVIRTPLLQTRVPQDEGPDDRYHINPCYLVGDVLHGAGYQTESGQVYPAVVWDETQRGWMKNESGESLTDQDRPNKLKKNEVIEASITVQSRESRKTSKEKAWKTAENFASFLSTGLSQKAAGKAQQTAEKERKKHEDWAPQEFRVVAHFDLRGVERLRKTLLSYPSSEFLEKIPLYKDHRDLHDHPPRLAPHPTSVELEVREAAKIMEGINIGEAEFRGPRSGKSAGSDIRTSNLQELPRPVPSNTTVRPNMGKYMGDSAVQDRLAAEKRESLRSRGLYEDHQPIPDGSRRPKLDQELETERGTGGQGPSTSENLALVRRGEPSQVAPNSGQRHGYQQTHHTRSSSEDSSHHEPPHR